MLHAFLSLLFCSYRVAVCALLYFSVHSRIRNNGNNNYFLLSVIAGFFFTFFTRSHKNDCEGVFICYAQHLAYMLVMCMVYGICLSSRYQTECFSSNTHSILDIDYECCPCALPWNIRRRKDVKTARMRWNFNHRSLAKDQTSHT